MLMNGLNIPNPLTEEQIKQYAGLTTAIKVALVKYTMKRFVEAPVINPTDKTETVNVAAPFVHTGVLRIACYSKEDACEQAEVYLRQANGEFDKNGVYWPFTWQLDSYRNIELGPVQLIDPKTFPEPAVPSTGLTAAEAAALGLSPSCLPIEHQ